MTLYQEDTIAALSTPPGFGGIAVIRVSGPQSLSTVQSVFKPAKKIKKWESHQLYLGWIHDKAPIDQVMLAWMKYPHSYTGEEVMEISCHGSPVIVQNILNLLYQTLSKRYPPCRVRGVYQKSVFKWAYGFIAS